MMYFLWSGLACFLGAGVLYVLGIRYDGEANFLKKVPRISQLKDLRKIVDTSCKKPLVVSVSGKVGSNSPIKCKKSGLKGVIWKGTVEHHYVNVKELYEMEILKKMKIDLCEIETEKVWRKKWKHLQTEHKEVPWHLDDGSCHVNVVGAQGATGLELTLASCVYQYTGGWCLNDTDTLPGLKRKEWILPIGTLLTVVGEAGKDGLGTIQIQRPHNGSFIVSSKNIVQLIAHKEEYTRFWKYASMVLLVVGALLLAKDDGVSLISKSVVRYIMERRRQ